ncbi:rhodanese-like domain-containing protein [Streptomyces violaceus]|uniref:Rhodanese-like domain-containing protein n=1 Tax=Streptomyces violaceus TaxID=1936 RepID=A0ABZ1P704_STRVL
MSAVGDTRQQGQVGGHPCRLAKARPPELAALTCGGSSAIRTAREHYRKEHIPGALYVGLDTELAAPGTPESGRHPLPDPASLQAAARRWGLSAGRPVVVYADNANTAAARAWWLLSWAGSSRCSCWTGRWTPGVRRGCRRRAASRRRPRPATSCSARGSCLAWTRTRRPPCPSSSSAPSTPTPPPRATPPRARASTSTTPADRPAPWTTAASTTPSSPTTRQRPTLCNWRSSGRTTPSASRPSSPTAPA